MTDYELMKLCSRFDFGCANAVAKSVLVSLASWYQEDAEGDGYAWRPSRQLAVDAACNRGSLAGAIRWLEDKGLIVTAKAAGKRTVYRFNVALIESGGFAPRKAVRETAPQAARNTAPRAVRETAPQAVRNTTPQAVWETAPKKKREEEKEKEREKKGGSDITFDSTSDRALVRAWVIALSRDADLSREVGREYRNTSGGIDINKLVADIYASSQMFDRFKWCFQELRARGVI